MTDGINPFAQPSQEPTSRQPITDIAEWLDATGSGVRATLQALGELLIGVTENDESSETADQFTARCLGATDCSHLINEERALNPVSRLTAGLALAQWIDHHQHHIDLGPGEHTQPPIWTQTEISDQRYRHPMCLRVHFPAGTLTTHACVIDIETREGVLRSAHVGVYVTPQNQAQARVVLDHLENRASELNPYRGRALRATARDGLSLGVISLSAPSTRDMVIVPTQVWMEVDLAVAAVRDHHHLLNSHSLGARRGVLLCGPPGTGKSAVSSVVANEVVGDFTVIYVDARAGVQLLTNVVAEAHHLSGPVLIVLEDIDLWARQRTQPGSAGLSELLAAMDISPEARIIVLASTNDATTLDAAAIRTGRFDSVVEIGYPTRTNAALILAALIRELPGSETIDADAIAAALPEHTSGSDIREIVRRAVLTNHDEHLSTAKLLAEVGTGRYLAQAPSGTYL